LTICPECDRASISATYVRWKKPGFFKKPGFYIIGIIRENPVFGDADAKNIWRKLNSKPLPAIPREKR
jgi:hypothetical protein